MRSLSSITAIAAVVFSALTPLLAAACPDGRQAPACHRIQAQKPHCAMKHDHHADTPALADEGPVMAGSEAPNCPMDCCIPGHPTNAVTVAAGSDLPPLAVVEYRLQFVPIAFVRTGFSSHTDRGPPSA
jgi:hypothetical protein